jgi:hypothetical protein
MTLRHISALDKETAKEGGWDASAIEVSVREPEREKKQRKLLPWCKKLLFKR